MPEVYAINYIKGGNGKDKRNAVYRYRTIPEDLAEAKTRNILRILENALRRQKLKETANVFNPSRPADSNSKDIETPAQTELTRKNRERHSWSSK